jgi:hypothetical protein
VGRCEKDHDDQKHPDQLIHFQQEAVGKVTDENVKKGQEGEKIKPGCRTGCSNETPDAERNVYRKEQQQTNQARIQQNIKKAVV